MCIVTGWHPVLVIVWDWHRPSTSSRVATYRGQALNLAKSLWCLKSKSFTSYSNGNNVILIEQYAFWVIPSFLLMTLHFDYQEKYRADQNACCLVIFTSLAKEVMFLVALVCLFVCLWTTLLKKVMNGLWWNFRAGFWVVQWRTD